MVLGFQEFKILQYTKRKFLIWYIYIFIYVFLLSFVINTIIFLTNNIYFFSVKWTLHNPLLSLKKFHIIYDRGPRDYRLVKNSFTVERGQWATVATHLSPDANLRVHNELSQFVRQIRKALRRRWFQTNICVVTTKIVAADA